MFEHILSQLLGYSFMKLLESHDPSSDVIDFHDAESVLFAASMLDQRGEWDKARELYEHALKQWPDEHGEYAKNSIREIEEKAYLGK